MKFHSLEKWKDIANDFAKFWNYPHCLGATEGKQIASKTPPNSGSDYFNCKGFCSIVLLAIMDSWVGPHPAQTAE